MHVGTLLVYSFRVTSGEQRGLLRIILPVWFGRRLWQVAILRWLSPLLLIQNSHSRCCVGYHNFIWSRIGDPKIGWLSWVSQQFQPKVARVDTSKRRTQCQMAGSNIARLSTFLRHNEGVPAGFTGMPQVTPLFQRKANKHPLSRHTHTHTRPGGWKCPISPLPKYTPTPPQ